LQFEPSDGCANICSPRSVEIHDEALRLVAAGINDCEIARRLGLPRTTVRDWREPRYVLKRPPSRCPQCGRRSRRIVLEPASCAELLGLYLGDGHVTELARSHRLRLFLDAKYPTIVDESEAILRTGKKHGRRILLEPWQHELVDAAPWAFLRGCIRSDGCAFINRTGRYEYLSYDFCNLSQDILGLFERVCLDLGLRPRRTSRRIRLNRRADVASLLEHVGLKT